MTFARRCPVCRTFIHRTLPVCPGCGHEKAAMPGHYGTAWALGRFDAVAGLPVHPRERFGSEAEHRVYLEGFESAQAPPADRQESRITEVSFYGKLALRVFEVDADPRIAYATPRGTR